MKPISYREWFRQWRMRRRWVKQRVQTGVGRPHDD